MISLEKLNFLHLYKNCLRVKEIWENKLLSKALKSCPKSMKSPNLVTLEIMNELATTTQIDATLIRVLQICFQMR